MSPHILHANKYQFQTTHFANPPAMIVALCEKAISCIASAQKELNEQKKHLWRTNLGTVQDIIQLIYSALSNIENSPNIREMESFYNDMSIYTAALIMDKIESSRAQELLESFRITRDMWKNIEHKYVVMKDGEKQSLSTDSCNTIL